MWFGIALGAALTQAAQFALVKARARQIPPLVLVLWAQALGMAVWGALFLLAGWPFTLPVGVLGWLAAGGVLAATMASLVARASARGDISVVGPMLALSPAFAIVPDWLASGALPSALGWLGLLLAVGGTASVSRGAPANGGWRRFLMRDDALAALGAAVILGVQSAIDRYCARLAGVPSYLLALHAVTALVVAGLVLVRWPRHLAATLARRELGTVLGNGLLHATGSALLITAFTLAPAAYVSATRRLSSVVSVVLGRALFDEPGFGPRLAGAVLACAGTALLLLAR